MAARKTTSKSAPARKAASSPARRTASSPAGKTATAPARKAAPKVTARKAAAKGTPRAKPKPRSKAGAKPAGKVDLHAMGARVVSVFGPFSSRVLIEMPAGSAERLFAGPLAASGRTMVSESVARDLAEIRKRAPSVADSTLAAAAQALALELDHPYNSATSKSMCAKALMEAVERLRELAPPPEKKDKVDNLAAQRATRRSQLA